MGRWLERFTTLTNNGIDGLTDSDISRHTPHNVEQAVRQSDREINARGIAIDAGFVPAD